VAPLRCSDGPPRLPGPRISLFSKRIDPLSLTRPTGWCSSPHRQQGILQGLLAGRKILRRVFGKYFCSLLEGLGACPQRLADNGALLRYEQGPVSRRIRRCRNRKWGSDPRKAGRSDDSEPGQISRRRNTLTAPPHLKCNCAWPSRPSRCHPASLHQNRRLRGGIQCAVGQLTR
jgi:hypothetical protein